jgi:hypothetical protein
MTKPSDKNYHGRRVGQTVCQVGWRDSRPYIKTGKVTAVTPHTYHVDGRKCAETFDWDADWRRAIEHEMYFWLNVDSPYVNSKGLDYTDQEIVERLARLWQLQRKLLARGRRRPAH